MKRKAVWKTTREPTSVARVYKLTNVHVETNEKRTPEKKYEARRDSLTPGKTETKCFKDFFEAKKWQKAEPSAEPEVVAPTTRIAAAAVPVARGMLFKEAFRLYEENRLSQISLAARNTKLARRRHFKFFIVRKLTMDEITPVMIDRWLRWIKDPRYVACQHSTRLSYQLEVKVLREIMRYYQGRVDNRYFIPVLREHLKMLEVRKRPVRPKKDLTLQDFGRVVELLDTLASTRKSARLAQVDRVVHKCVQLIYVLRGRGQEIPALEFEDMDNPRPGTVRLRRKVIWHRKQGLEPEVVEGHKATGGHDVPSPLACRIMKEWAFREGIRSGPLFYVGGKVITGRMLEHRLNWAFKKLGIPQSGVHVLRHGSLTEFYEQCGNNLKEVQKAANHKSIVTTQRYVGVRENNYAQSVFKMDTALQETLS